MTVSGVDCNFLGILVQWPEGEEGQTMVLGWVGHGYMY